MLAKDIFSIDMPLGYLAWALCIATYVWPRLRAMDQVEAHRAIATFHSFRFFGLAFLLPGFVGPNSAAGLRNAGGLRRPRHRTARHPRTADSPRALPLLAAGLDFQSGRSRRSRHWHCAWGQRKSAGSGGTARSRLRDPHAVCARAFLDAHRRVLAAAAVSARSRSVGRCAHVAGRD